MIMEAEKFHGLPSASWRTTKASGTVPVQNESPKNQGSHWHASSSESESQKTRSTDVRGQKIDVSAQAKSKFSLPLLSCVLFRPSMDCMMPTLIGEGHP